MSVGELGGHPENKVGWGDDRSETGMRKVNEQYLTR